MVAFKIDYSLLNDYTLEDIRRMYIDEKYSMELISRVTKINIAFLSRVIWYSGMANERRIKYGDHAFLGEVTRMDSNRFSMPSPSMEDKFFEEL